MRPRKGGIAGADKAGVQQGAKPQEMKTGGHWSQIPSSRGKNMMDISGEEALAQVNLGNWGKPSRRKEGRKEGY